MLARVRNLVARIDGAKQAVIAAVRRGAVTCVCDTTKIESAEQPVVAKRIVARAIKTRRRTLGAGDAAKRDETNDRHYKRG